MGSKRNKAAGKVDKEHTAEKKKRDRKGKEREAIKED